MSGHLDDEQQTYAAIAAFSQAEALMLFTLDNLRQVRARVLDSNCIDRIDGILSIADGVERK